MKTVYTTTRNEYYTSKLTEDGKDVISTPADIMVNKDLPAGPRDDIFFDWLDCCDFYDPHFMDKYIPELTAAGYDMNLDNYVQIVCPYLPFRHYVHTETGKFY